MKQVRLCKDCKWSSPDKQSSWELRCKNPQVNAKDSWALAQVEFNGSHCKLERESGWFKPCGMKGKQWQPKEITGGLMA